ncbi:MAG TPA: ABC transporter ATP-binding protein [Syntrophomonadaceae bacterium]|nr:ABC transporter ATP-binding protein [Syntrophomonadaceae bacterium]
MNDFAVDVQGLSKWYGQLKAVDNVSFQVHKGSSFGLLGLNGAGKTTTFKMMVSLIRPNSGTAIVSGYDVVKAPMKVRSHIGYVAENPAFYTRMTTQETLRYVCRLLDVPVNDQNRRIDYVLGLVGLTDKKSALVGGYSRGMRHRLGLAQALLSEPQVLFLDEPTLGLDPLGAKNMRELILRLRQEKEVTVLMSSHVLPEVEAICDMVGIFDHGRIVAMDTIDHLRSTASDSLNIELVMAESNEEVLQALRSIPGVIRAEALGVRLDITASKNEDLRPRIMQEALANNAKVLSFGLKESSLEDILLHLVKSHGSDLPEQSSRLNPASFFRMTRKTRR